MNIFVGRKDIVHDDEMDLATMRKFYSVKTVESTEQGVRILDDMFVVVLQDGTETIEFGGVDGVDDESIIAGEVEEGV